MPDLPYLERVKIQIEILLPLYRLLRKELGEDKAAALLREAVAEYARDLGRQVGESSDDTSLDKLRGLMPMFIAGNALDVEPVSNDEREVSLNVRGCRYADLFRSLGEPEFGAMVTCEMDFPMTEGIGSDLRLERTQTILNGGSHCDFRWKSERGNSRT